MHPVAQRVADRAVDQVGYVEKPVNRTKFSQELDAVEHPRIPRDGSPWCGSGIDWCVFKENALPALIFRCFGTSVCAQHHIAAKAWSAKDAAPGKLAFKALSGPGHIGFILDADTIFGIRKVRTVEFNTTSGIFGSQTNGGMVAIRTRLGSWWAGFGQPNWDLVENASVDLHGIAALVAAFRQQTLWAGTMTAPASTGPAVSFWQRSIGVPDTGRFDSATAEQTKVFQYLFRQRQKVMFGIPDNDPMGLLLPVTGVVDSHTWACRLDFPD
jgi:hypothetical protein